MDCLKCSIPYDEISNKIYSAIGKWICKNCDSEEFKKYCEGIERDDSKEWTWKNYYGYVHNHIKNNSKDIIPEIPRKLTNVILELGIVENMCLECKKNNRMKSCFLCEDCLNNYWKFRNHAIDRNNFCKICLDHTFYQYCIRCMTDVQRVKLIQQVLDKNSKKLVTDVQRVKPIQQVLDKNSKKLVRGYDIRYDSNGKMIKTEKK
tara:strand:- start:57 stop:671 length:615 start_codon:yes stop_codon:yes gene_type:complete